MYNPTSMPAIFIETVQCEGMYDGGIQTSVQDLKKKKDFCFLHPYVSDTVRVNFN